MTPLSPTKILTRAEAKAILESVEPTCITKLQKRAMLETLYRAGLREIELVNLRRSQVEWPCEDNGGHCVLHLVRTKGNRPRSVPVPDALHEWLARWRLADENWKSEMDRESAYFFHPILRNWERSYSTQTIRNILVPICEGAIGRHVNLHMLRHTYATNCAEAGVPVPGLQRLLGHRDVATTMVYVDVRGEVLAEQVRGLT